MGSGHKSTHFCLQYVTPPLSEVTVTDRYNDLFICSLFTLVFDVVVVLLSFGVQPPLSSLFSTS